MPENTAPALESALRELLGTYRDEILQDWLKHLTQSSVVRSGLVSEAELREQSREIVGALANALRNGSLTDIRGTEWSSAREILSSLSASRARQGASASDTAHFVLSLKWPLLSLVEKHSPAEALGSYFRTLAMLVDQLSLFTVDTFIKARESVIQRQQQEMLELSTPVVKLFEGVVALPLIGTLDSARTQVVMESLLQEIVDTGASIAILDITGVPTVDTLVAQHLLKTVAAARLMGAECIISGIRPQIAQTIVHLGVELQNVVTKATLADALRFAMQRLGLVVVSTARPAGAE